MKKISFYSILVLVTCFLDAPSALAESVRGGKWSMTVVTKMPGMEAQAAEMQQAMQNMSPEEKAMMQQMMGGMSIGPAAGGMSTTITKCVSEDNPVPQVSEQQDDCQTTHSMNGNTVHFESVCKDSASTGDITYSGDSMQGVIQSNGANGNVTIEISGQYLGPCS